MIKIDKKSYKSVDIYYIGCVITKYLYDEDVDSVCPMYLINEMDGYIEEENENQYIILFLQIKTKKYQKNTQNVGMKLKI